MKAIIPCVAISITFLTAADRTLAQSAAAYLQPPPQSIAIDGSVKEWGDSLRYQNVEKHISYSLANDRDNLYMAVRLDDKLQQRKVLRSGLTFSINPKGKKKETFSITYPLSLQGGSPLSGLQQDNSSDDPELQQEALKQAVLTDLRRIKVEGFTDIEGDMITTSNTYGIKTAISYDDKGALVCEAAIPLKFFHADDAVKNEWAFNFRINGAARPVTRQPAEGGTRSGGRGGRGGGGFGGGGRGGRGGGRNGNQNSDPAQGEFSRPEEFWEKFYLAK